MLSNLQIYKPKIMIMKEILDTMAQIVSMVLHIFTELCLWADLVFKLQCPNVVCVFVLSPKKNYILLRAVC